MRVIALAVVCAAACGSSGDPLEVKVEQGTLHGIMQGDLRAFLGIPYAAPPIGPDRLRPPQPAPAFDGTYQAASIGNQCPQSFGLSSGGGDESCLYLNVWSPPDADHLPVMVWFHGGAFIFGSGGDPYYRGTALASHGVVVVTVNYRLGALGFLAHPALTAEDPAHPSSGNYGLLDQIAALRWVHANIAGFGGDPDRVTIFGESAGGFSACEHYVSPRSRGLFHAVISESGLCNAGGVPEPTLASAEQDGVTFAGKLGCTGSGAAVLACLRAKTPFDFLDAAALPPMDQQAPGGLLFQPTTYLAWAPVIDGDLITKPLHDAFAAGDYDPAPLLLGTNRDEGTFFLWDVLAIPVADEAEYRAALARRFPAASIDAIVARYPVASYPTPNAALAAVSGDAFFVCPARRTARAAAAHGAPVFLYSFERTLESSLLGDAGGVFHASELPFVFGIDEFPLGKVGAGGAPLSEAMQRDWTRFAATGAPGTADEPWPALGDNDAYLRLDVPVAAAAGYKTALCDFWDTQLPP